jgi:hypothetical protein
VRKGYDKAQTPYQRLPESRVLTEAKQQKLAATYHDLNPVLLLKQINENLECLWKLAERPAHQPRKAKNSETANSSKTFGPKNNEVHISSSSLP